MQEEKRVFEAMWCRRPPIPPPPPPLPTRSRPAPALARPVLSCTGAHHQGNGEHDTGRAKNHASLARELCDLPHRCLDGGRLARRLDRPPHRREAHGLAAGRGARGTPLGGRARHPWRGRRRAMWIRSPIPHRAPAERRATHQERAGSALRPAKAWDRTATAGRAAETTVATMMLMRSNELAMRGERRASPVRWLDLSNRAAYRSAVRVQYGAPPR